MDNQSDKASIAESTSTNGPLPSNKLAEKLMNEAHQSQTNSQVMQDMLLQLQSKKNPNYKSFTKHIHMCLKLIKPTFEESVKSLSRINKMMEQKFQIKKGQILSIFEGYFFYWKTFVSLTSQTADYIQKMTLILSLFMDFPQVACLEASYSVKKYFVVGASSQSQKQFNENALEFINNHIKDSYYTFPCLALIHTFDLYGKIGYERVLQVILREKYFKIQFIFRNGKKEIKEELVEAYITKKLPKQTEDLKKLIQKFSLNAEKYPKLIKVLQKNTLNYYRRTEDFVSVELKIAKKPFLIKLLIEILIDQGDYEKASHLINKYYVKEFYYLTLNKSFLKNHLEEHDRFLPTEAIKEGLLNYITLKQYGIRQPDVIFINDVSQSQKALKKIGKKQRFGIDCESVPVFHAFEKKQISLLQISLQNRIYIFDLLFFKQNKKFAASFKQFIKNYKGAIVGQSIENQIAELLEEMNIQDKSLVKNLTIFDVGKIYRQKFVFDTKYNLKHIAKQLLKKDLSKYEQCSGWDVRPLRKAQLHYAGLDAFLPLKLYDELEKIK